MKIINFRAGAATRLGFLVDHKVIDPIGQGGKPEWFADTVAFIAGGTPALQAAAEIIGRAVGGLHLADLALAPPIRPSTILCSGSNYAAHNKEKKNTPLSGKEPEFFVKTSDSVIGPDEAIVCDPVLTKKLDCETELAVVIGKPGRHISVEQAPEHIFGYTIVNDVTARDRQVRTSPEGLTWYELGRGKAFDTSAPLGPAIVTADEIRDPQNLKVMTRINGELRQSSNTEDMIWSCAQLIHFFSINFTLRPGMVIITGTPAGTAWSTDASLGGRWQPEPGLVAAARYCLPGDVVESEVEKIGILRNPVI